MRVLRVIRRHGLWNPGEIAGFDDAMAENLIAKGFAVDPAAEAEAEAAAKAAAEVAVKAKK
jgi:hypothetical protein